MTETSSQFWDFSLRVYGQPGVADECLELQERLGTNVNLLLFCAFCGARFGAKFSTDELAEASALVSVWHADVTKSFRRARTAIKRLQPADSASSVGTQAEKLRQDVKKLELSAERVEHALLEDWWQTKSFAVAVPASNPDNAVKSNIAMLVGHSAEASVLANAALADRNGTCQSGS
jgi:uncharacterized protein (TIGR02444 family)